MKKFWYKFCILLIHNCDILWYRFDCTWDCFVCKTEVEDVVYEYLLSLLKNVGDL